jgi:hypothetical protein
MKSGRMKKFCSDRIYRIFRIVVFGKQTTNILLILLAPP